MKGNTELRVRIELWVGDPRDKATKAWVCNHGEIGDPFTHIHTKMCWDNKGGGIVQIDWCFKH